MPSYQAPSKEVLQTLETAPNMYLILAPDLHIITASNLYLKATETSKEAIVGKHIFEAFPNNPDWPEADGVQNINASLQEVLRTKQPHYMQVQKYDVPDRNHPGKFIERYWDPSHTPVLDEHGEIQYIIQLATNVTDQVHTERALIRSEAAQQESLDQVKALNEKLAAANEELLNSYDELQQSEEKLRNLNEELELRVRRRTQELTESELRFRSIVELSPVAMLVTRGEEMVFAVVNDAMLEILGKDSSVLGKPAYEIVASVEGEAIVSHLLHTYYTGEERREYEVPIKLNRIGKPGLGYFNISYRPWFEKGKVVGVMQTVVEVTNELLSKQKAEQAERNLRLATEAARVGTWYINPGNKALEYNTMLAEIFGFEGEERMTYDQAIAQVTDEYRPLILKAIEEAITSGGDYDFTYQQRRFNDNKLIWLRSLGKIKQDENGAHTLFSGIAMDVTAQKQEEQRKNDFIGMVSHELKTPLTSMSAYVQMLLIKARKAEDMFTANALEKANNQVRKMTAMINGFLNVSRLDSGNIHIDKSSFDMAALVKETEEETMAIVSSHRVIFAPVMETSVLADKSKIGQVINNFISNAVKYSPLNSTIQVACVTIGNSAQLSVKDEGIGIKAEDQAKLFDRFYRVENQQTHTISGFGIGLYLCAEIINRHEGRIWIESEPGKGSTFYFSIPLAEIAH